MAFTDADLRELLNRLRQDPVSLREFRDLLRDPVLDTLVSEVASLARAEGRTDERLAVLTDRVCRLAEAQRETEQRLGVLMERMDGLAVAQTQMEERLIALTQRVDQLAEAQRRSEERLAELAEAQRHTEQSLAALIEHVDSLAVRTADLVGESLERRYREQVGAYFGQVLRRSRVLNHLALEAELEDRLSEEEIRDVLRTDVVVSGKPRNRPDVEEVWLAVEVSSVIDGEDVRRAVRRSRLLARSGRPVIPVVAGERITTRADEAARDQKVVIVEDGRFSNWDEALATALAAA